MTEPKALTPSSAMNITLRYTLKHLKKLNKPKIFDIRDEVPCSQALVSMSSRNLLVSSLKHPSFPMHPGPRERVDGPTCGIHIRLLQQPTMHPLSIHSAHAPPAGKRKQHNTAFLQDCPSSASVSASPSARPSVCPCLSFSLLLTTAQEHGGRDSERREKRGWRWEPEDPEEVGTRVGWEGGQSLQKSSGGKSQSRQNVC